METTHNDADFNENSLSLSLNHKFPEKIQPFQLPRLSQIFEVLPLGLRFAVSFLISQLYFNVYFLKIFKLYL